MYRLLFRSGALALATAAGMTLVACGGPASAPATDTPTPTDTSVTFTDEQVRTAAKLEAMRGHLFSSVANADAGNLAMARMHAGHPYAEGYLALHDQIEAVSSSLAQRAGQTLQQTYSAVADTTDPAVFASAAEKANALVDELTSALVPESLRNSLGFHAAVLGSLFELSADEYSTRVHDGQVDVLEEYQDGFGFYSHGKQLWAQIEDQSKSADPNAYAEIEHQLAELNGAFPAVLPPTAAVAPADVLAWTEAIARELEQAAGATSSGTPTASREAAGQLSNRAQALDEALTAIANGDVAGAQAAYTEFDSGWFEIEDGVRAKSRDAYRDIEEAMSSVKDVLIRSQTPNLDKAKVAIDQLDAVIDAALPELR